jgi:hypothetical protein
VWEQQQQHCGAPSDDDTFATDTSSCTMEELNAFSRLSLSLSSDVVTARILSKELLRHCTTRRSDTTRFTPLLSCPRSLRLAALMFPDSHCTESRTCCSGVCTEGGSPSTVTQRRRERGTTTTTASVQQRRAAADIPTGCPRLQ